MSCIEQMKYKLLLERTSFREAREYIEKNSDEVYYVDPGYKIFKDYYIIGVPPVAIGVKGNELIFTYVKPCHGTFVMSLESEEEINRLREREKEKLKASLAKGGKREKEKAEAVPSTSFQDLWKK
ncbi:MAG: DUF1894 domain-containing protein [Methanotrichaceae archaeon]|nr:DUF1894 domain-containing protein [Methanotrichaceae archaeon]